MIFDEDAAVGSGDEVFEEDDAVADAEGVEATTAGVGVVVFDDVVVVTAGVEATTAGVGVVVFDDVVVVTAGVEATTAGATEALDDLDAVGSAITGTETTEAETVFKFGVLETAGVVSTSFEDASK